MPILETRNLSKIYPGAEPAVALNGVNLSLEKGEHVAIVGGSGSRTSTLLHMLGGVEKPIEGKAIIQDVDIAALKERNMAIFRRRNIGIIHQLFNLIPNPTVEKSILRSFLLDERKADPSFFQETVETLGIENKINVSQEVLQRYVCNKFRVNS